MGERIVIVGQGPRAFEHLSTDEVWVINGPRMPKRWDVLFQLHGLEHLEHKHGEKFIQFLKDFPSDKRLLMTRTYDDIPRAEGFPISSVRSSAGYYLTGSVALAIAYATLFYSESNQIVLDGMMFSGGPAQWGAGEGWAVPCIEYHIGRALALGFEVVVPPGCGLFAQSDFVYGFEGPGSI